MTPKIVKCLEDIFYFFNKFIVHFLYSFGYDQIRSSPKFFLIYCNIIRAKI